MEVEGPHLHRVAALPVFAQRLITVQCSRAKEAFSAQRYSLCGNIGVPSLIPSFSSNIYLSVVYLK